MRFPLPALAAAAALTCHAGAAHALLIDAFDGTITQTALINGASGTDALDPPDVAVGGLTRNGSISASAAGNYSINVNDVGFPGVAAFSIGTNNSESLMRLTYTGALDLSTLSRIVFDIPQLDNELVTFGVALTDGAANSTQVTEERSLPGTFSAPLSSFTGVDLADITTLTIIGDTRADQGDVAADWQIDNIRATPLPGTMALLALGAVGLGARRLGRR